MNDQDEALKADAEVNSETESPAEKGNISETTEVSTGEATVEPEEKQDDEDKRSAKARIRELAEEKNVEKQARLKAEDEAKSLKDTIAKLNGVDLNDNEQLQYVPGMTQADPLIKPGEEYLDPAELDRRIADRDKNLFNAVRLMNAAERNSHRQIDEIGESQSKYPQLVKGSGQFDPDISEAVTQSVDSFLRSNPTGSVKEHVDKIMKPYLRAIEKGVGEQQETVTKQVSETALRPTHITQGEKKFEDMSLKEMESALGGVHR